MKTLPITRNGDFLRIYRRGKSVAGPYLVAYVFPNRLGITRLGLTTSKKIGNAVARNRARRVLRAAYREISPRIRAGIDIILVARTKTTFIKSTALTPIMTAQLEKLGALTEQEKIE